MIAHRTVRRPVADPTRDGRDSGVSLAETLVTMVVLALLMVAVTTMVISTQRIANRTRLLDGNTQQLRVALDETSKLLRAAYQPDPTTPAFLLSTHATVNGKTIVNNGTECWVLTNVGSSGSPQLAHLYVDVSKRQLIEEITAPAGASSPPNYVYTAAPYRTRVLASGLAIPSGTATPIFTYFPPAADPTTSVPYNGPLSATSGPTTLVSYVVPDANLLSVSDVQITLAATSTGIDGSSTTMNNRVRLVNAAIANASVS